MAEQLDPTTFTGAHPTVRDFRDRLLAWGFVQRGQVGPHIVYRAPAGGRVKLLGSLLGRVDASQVAKAARFLNITVAEFWTGPTPHSRKPDPTRSTNTAPPPPRRRSRTGRDSDVAIVLAAHAQADRPLGFDEVVDLIGGRLTREQVRAASNALYRSRHLDRILHGVYQWSRGTRATRPQPPPAAPPTRPDPQATDRPAEPSATSSAAPEAELFARLFPHGARLTAETLADFLRLASLASKLSDQAQAS